MKQSKVMKNSKESNNRKLKSVLLGLFLFSTIALSIFAIKLNSENEAILKKSVQDRAELTLKHQNSFLEIENNLKEVTAHEEALRGSMLEPNGQRKLTPEEKVQQEILIIEALIDKNDRIIADLQSQLSENDEKLIDYTSKNRRLESKLKKFVERSNELEEMNLQLAEDLKKSEEKALQLEGDLTASLEANEALGAEIVVRDQIISDKEEKLSVLQSSYNASYYIVGEYKDLRDLNVVEKEGGLAGIGAVKTLKDDFDAEQFTQIDRNNYKTIPVFAKKAELATSHPSESYEWVENEEGIQWLKINDPITFWKSSKYLVILTDKSLEETEMLSQLAY